MNTGTLVSWVSCPELSGKQNTGVKIVIKNTAQQHDSLLFL